jgi:hypothetical protein
MNKELGNLATVRLVRRHREDQLHRADELAPVEGGENHASSTLDLAGPILEDGERVLVCERLEVAHGCTPGDAVGEHGGQGIELLVQVVSLEASDPDLSQGAARCPTPRCQTPVGSPAVSPTAAAAT